MSEKTVKKTISVCDSCGREADFLHECSMCGREVCSTCTRIGRCVESKHLSYDDSPFGNVVCVDCSKIPGVLGILDKYVIKWKTLRTAEFESLKKLKGRGELLR
jgi:hypothetical protein